MLRAYETTKNQYVPIRLHLLEAEIKAAVAAN
jgi:hypothetical protein